MAKPVPKWLRITASVVSVVVVLLFLLVWWDHHTKMGTRLKISDLESVNYSGSATEKEAADLGAALQKVGYFQGKRQIDVLLFKGPKGTVLSFVTNHDGWTKPEMEQAFREVGESVAGAVGGKPIVVRLVDSKLVTRKEISLE